MSYIIDFLSTTLGRVLLAALVAFLFWCLSCWVKAWLMPHLTQWAERKDLKITSIFVKAFTKPTPVLVWVQGLCIALPMLPLSFVSSAKLAAISTTIFRAVSLLCLGWGLIGTSDVCGFLIKSTNRALDVETNQTLLTMLKKVYKALVVVFAALAALDVLGYPVTGLVTGVGLVGLTVSLAAQDSASNLFSGLMILLEKPFAIGDWISVNGVEGVVEDLTFRSTKVRALDNSIYILPNTAVTGATINNGAARVKRLYRFTLGVTYDATRPQLETLMAHLTQLLNDHPCTEKSSIIVRLTGFGDSSIDILVSTYITEADAGKFMEIQNNLNLDILDMVRNDGLDFAFPSTSVYIEKNAK